MKNLVLGTLVSVLSFSALAADTQHSKSMKLTVMVGSTGTELTIVECPGSSPVEGGNYLSLFQPTSVGQLSTDGNKGYAWQFGPVGKMYDFAYDLSSLYYGETFSVCARAKLRGGYIALSQSHTMVLGAALGVSPLNGSTSYVTDSGLQAKVDISCRKWGQDWGTTGIQNVVSMFPVATMGRVETELEGNGLPMFCDTRITFKETNEGVVRQIGPSNNQTKGVMLYIDLDAAILN
jgi:hypothetical protein